MPLEEEPLEYDRNPPSFSFPFSIPRDLPPIVSVGPQPQAVSGNTLCRFRGTIIRRMRITYNVLALRNSDTLGHTPPPDVTALIWRPLVVETLIGHFICEKAGGWLTIIQNKIVSYVRMVLEREETLRCFTRPTGWRMRGSIKPRCTLMPARTQDKTKK